MTATLPSGQAYLDDARIAIDLGSSPSWLATRDAKPGSPVPLLIAALPTRLFRAHSDRAKTDTQALGAGGNYALALPFLRFVTLGFAVTWLDSLSLAVKTSTNFSCRRLRCSMSMMESML